jgi:FkbM family methyltransferase
MKNIPLALLRRLVKRHPFEAIRLAAPGLSISGLTLNLTAGSPLYRDRGGRTVELPIDGIISPAVVATGVWQEEELTFIGEHLPQAACALVDVGANVGLVTRQLMHRFARIEGAVCFEPHPGNFRMLAHNLAHLPQCTAVPAALGTESGKLRFYEDEYNAGNYSLNRDSLRGRPFRETEVDCLDTSEDEILGRLPEATRTHRLVWKSDTQGFDEIIATRLPNTFWARVAVGIMEISRIDKPSYDQARLGAILDQFPIRRFSSEPSRNLATAEILSFASGRDTQYADLYFAR